MPMTSRAFIPVALAIALSIATWSWLPAASADLVSYARVRDDATLKVGGRQIVRLYGIHVPPTGRRCRTNLRPARCASRAALALDFKIQGFVSCREIHRHRDRSISAVCHNKGVDLGAYLIQRGWAVARPDAPFQYEVLERIAQQHYMGVWGFQADVITRGRFPRKAR